jgi:hypothetical protein
MEKLSFGAAPKSRGEHLGTCFEQYSPLDWTHIPIVSPFVAWLGLGTSVMEISELGRKFAFAQLTSLGNESSSFYLATLIHWMLCR